jgi:tetratricopeptide (TPR) repeat protein
MCRAYDLQNRGDRRLHYLLVMDADDALEYETSSFSLKDRIRPIGRSNVYPSAYRFPILFGTTGYQRTQLFRADGDYHYEGVLHEALVPSNPATEPVFPGVLYRCSAGGARSRDPDKYRKDAELLEEELKRRPDHTRTAFYLAQSWRDAGESEKARAAYLHRATMPGGWDEETWVALYEAARILEQTSAPEPEVVYAYLQAYHARPHRAESLCNLAKYLRLKGQFEAAYLFAEKAMKMPRPADLLFVDETVYAYRAKDECAVAAYWTGRYAEGMRLNQELLTAGVRGARGVLLPESETPRVQKNLEFCLAKTLTQRSLP